MACRRRSAILGTTAPRPWPTPQRPSRAFFLSCVISLGAGRDLRIEGERVAGCGLAEGDALVHLLAFPRAEGLGGRRRRDPFTFGEDLWARFGGAHEAAPPRRRRA